MVCCLHARMAGSEGIASPLEIECLLGVVEDDVDHESRFLVEDN